MSLGWGHAPAKGVSFAPPGDREKSKGNELFKEGRCAIRIASLACVPALPSRCASAELFLTVAAPTC